MVQHAARMVEAILLERDLTLRLGFRELPAPAAGEALVRVERAGVCGSDLHVLRTGAWVSHWPATLGHEVIGIVEHCPAGELAAGQRVVVDSRVPCADCAGCAEAPNRCERLAWVGEAFPGGFESHLVAPARNLVTCPPGLDPAVGVLSEPLAVAMHAVGRLRQPPQRVLMLGYGPIGALVHLEIARRWPAAAVTVREPDPGRRQLAAAMGADTEAGHGAAAGADSGTDTEAGNGTAAGADSGTAAGADTRSAAGSGSAAAAGGARWPLVVDAAGYAGSLADAVAMAANGGSVLAVALGHDPVELVPARIVESGLAILGSNGFDAELPEAVALLASDPARWRPLISETVSLKDAAVRLSGLVGTPSAGKVLIRP